jgi:DNA-binding NtrC family response regulator
MKILLMEDEIITETDLKNILDKKWHSVLPIFRNYQDGLNRLKNTTIEILVVDIRRRYSSLDLISITVVPHCRKPETSICPDGSNP